MTPYAPQALASNAGTPQISAASLPPELRAVIDRVLKRTGLWPRERADVESELAAHFADGLASGLSIEKLIEDFGDPAAAAGLIRRAKIRGRSRAWHALRVARNITLGAVGLVVLSYVGLTIRYYTGTPTIAWDFRKELNAPVLAIPQDQRAWPKIKLALEALVNPPREKETDENGNRLPPLSPFDAPAGAQVNQRAIALLRSAAAFPNLGLIVDDGEDYLFINRQLARIRGDKDWANNEIPVPPKDGPAISILLPHLGPIRSFCRLLMRDVDDGVNSKDTLAVSEDLVAAARLAVLNRETPFLITDLVSIAIGEAAMSKMQEVLTVAPSLVSDKALVQFSETLTSMGPRRQLIRFDTELRGFEDVLQRSFTDDGNGDGRLTPAGARMLIQYMNFGSSSPNPAPVEFAVSPVSSTFGPGRKHLQGLYSSMVKQVQEWQKSPRWARTTPPPDPEGYKLGTQTLSPYSFINLFMPAFNNSVYAADKFDASRDATLAVIAIEQFKRARGSFPSSLSELVPEFLPAMPLDPADGRPLRYKSSGNTYTLYSIGVNLKDDGGTPPTRDEGESTAFEFRSQNLDLSKVHNDWVFHPRLPEQKTPKTN